MADIFKYPILPKLPVITHHDQLPSGSVELGRCLNTTEAEDLYVLVKRDELYLSILVSYILHLKTGDKYSCHQFDFPLKVLSWFPKALEEFRKPPIEGGLHAGAMTTKDVDLENEMLSIISTTDGYALVNSSRTSPTGSDLLRIGWLDLHYDFLYQQGFLALITDFGEEYDKGLL